ncbi:MAG: hypothetical protein HY840_09440 [Bacteroidetes bacterium]|nr:hypothetical protein [Bacteroidota bacterium]
MTRIIQLLLAFALINYSCNTNTFHQTNNETKDSILKKYISIVDTLPYYDTSSIEFKLIKAYSSNDTNTLKKLVGHFENMTRKLDWQINLDSCVKQQAFKDIRSEEKYRFNYSAALCPYATSATIINYKDSTVLNTIVYQYAWDTLPCKVIEQTTVAIDSVGWAMFQESLEVADFWGLRPDNGEHGVDGSTLEIYGFKKGTNSEWDPDRSNFIERWSPAYNSILSSFTLLLKYSKTKKGCITAL